MSKKNMTSGLNRLSILVGLIGLISALAFDFYYTDGFSRVRASEVNMLVITTISSAIIPFVLTQGIKWTIQGFNSEK